MQTFAERIAEFQNVSGNGEGIDRVIIQLFGNSGPQNIYCRCKDFFRFRQIAAEF